ncbi:MAG: transcriptional regulator with XRE-family HTH domain [Polyangiales bacterium]|jgi:transcriptional regulator with XRE-family HTH domain
MLRSSMSPTPSPVGSLLRKWRLARKMTQLELASEAEISTRHLSFVETGKSNASSEMILILASALELPLRERNALLVSAGFAPAYRETSLDSPDMGQVRMLIDFMLKQAEPFGAVVVDGCWNLVRANTPAKLFTGIFVSDPAAVLRAGPPNMVRLLLHPAGLRERCVNWSTLARDMVCRLHREVAVTHDRRLASLLDEVLAYEGVPKDWRRFDIEAPQELLLPMHVRHRGFDLRLYTAITTLGSAQDISLQELRIETFFPADAKSDAQLRGLAGAGQSGS